MSNKTPPLRPTLDGIDLDALTREEINDLRTAFMNANEGWYPPELDDENDDEPVLQFVEEEEEEPTPPPAVPEEAPAPLWGAAATAPIPKDMSGIAVPQPPSMVFSRPSASNPACHLPPPEQRRQWSAPKPLCLSDLSLQPDSYPAVGMFPTLVELVKPLGLPPAHAWAAGIAALSTCVGRWWVLDTIQGGLRSNVFIWMLSGSGGGKGLTVKILRGLLAKNPQFIETGMPRSQNAYLECLIENDTAPICWVMEEGSSLFAQILQPHARDLPEAFCQAFDGSDISLRRAKRADREATTTAVNPCPTHLVTTTIDAMVGSLPYSRVKHMFTDGFFARFMIVPGQRKMHLPAPWDDRVMTEMAASLEHLATVRPPLLTDRLLLTLSADALTELHMYLAALENVTDALAQGAWARCATFAQKIAVLYHASTGESYDKPISGDTMLRALRCVHTYLFPAAIATAQRCALAGNAERIHEVCETLDNAPTGCFIHELTQRFDLPQKALHQALAVLADRIEFSAWGRTGRPGRARYRVAWQERTPDTIEGWTCHIRPEENPMPEGVRRSLGDYETRAMGRVDWGMWSQIALDDGKPTTDQEEPKKPN